MHAAANDQRPDAYGIYRYEIATEKRELVFGEPGLWSMDDLRDEGGSRKLLLSKATGALTAEYWEYDEVTKKLSPLFGQGEKEEYRAAYAGTAGELVVLTPKLGDFRRLYRVTPKGKALDTKDLEHLPSLRLNREDERAHVLSHVVPRDDGVELHADTVGARELAAPELLRARVRPRADEGGARVGADAVRCLRASEVEDHRARVHRGARLYPRRAAGAKPPTRLRGGGPFD